MASGTRQLLRYRFDNLMARGAGAQILLLAAATAVLITITGIALALYGGLPDDAGTEESFGWLIWYSLMHAVDAGAVAGDTGAWTFLFIMLFVTFGGIFIFSALIGVLNNGFTNVIESLRRGRSPVIERNHTVILGWSAKIHTLLGELAVAGANRRDACAVILADRDKVEMDEELRGSVARGLRVVTRRGNPMDLADLALTCLPSSKAVVVLPPDDADAAQADAMVLKTLLAIAKARSTHPLHVVAELQSAATERVARMVAGPGAALVVSPPLISRLLVQTGRQSGLSVIYTELLDFGGVEIYIQPEPALVGKTFRDAVFGYEDSTLIGVMTEKDEILLPPAFDRPFVAGDNVIAISEDDDTVVISPKQAPIASDQIVAAKRESLRHRERTLVLGASDRLNLVLAELAAYVAPGSDTLVVGESPWIDVEDTTITNDHMTTTRRPGDVTKRELLDDLAIGEFDHILLLSETQGREQGIADARTMITLLHLRDMLQRLGKKVPITSEILEIENRDLATIAEADDFIVSNTLVSLLISQVAENRHLVRVFDDLFSAGGFEIYLKPAADYVAADVEMPFATVVEAALRRGEVALGVRIGAQSRDDTRAFGVVINPAKSSRMRLVPGDKVIVLADD